MVRLIIPELEEIAKNDPGYRLWSDHEVRILRSYYGRIPTRKLAEYLNRTVGSVQIKARMLGFRFHEG
jgi:predicted Zn-dependent protease